MWAKPDSTWSWTLHAMPDGRTRLVTRLRQRYRAAAATVVTVILAEFGDFPMMRKSCSASSSARKPRRTRAPIRGIPAAAAASKPQRDERSIQRPAQDSIDLYWFPLGANSHSVRWNGIVYEALAALHERRRSQTSPLRTRGAPRRPPVRHRNGAGME